MKQLFNIVRPRAWLAGLVFLSLSACGGGSVDSSVNKGGLIAPVSESAGASLALSKQAVNAAPNAQTIAQQKEGARLNKAELEEIARTGVLPEPFDGPLLSGVKAASAEEKSFGEPKSAASRTAVFRFFNTLTSAHFFTTSTTERDNVRATSPHMTYEGTAFYASGAAVPGLSPVHRFYNTRTGVHFYTISEAERALVASSLPVFTYEGIAYFASTLPGTGYVPLYRFFYAARGFHFYTNSDEERRNINFNSPQYLYEGIGYYVLGSDWQTPAVPHTGIGFSQCYQARSNTMWACLRQLALVLNPQQDGHRANINRMSYSQLVSGYDFVYPIFVARYYPKTDCVRDDVTGLIWEGKGASGLRAGSNVYTNHGDSRAGDAGAYVTMVNAMNLCGFNDWRLPQAEELQGLLLLGKAIDRIDSEFFPNTIGGEYWTSTADANDPAKAWRVQFGTGVVYSNTRADSTWLRLVRGSVWSGPRYMITSAPYGSDRTGNAVLDRKTGLTWRRCLEGSDWTGGGCTSWFRNYDHEGALLAGNVNRNWRLPNIKELASQVRYEVNLGTLDPTLFPALQSHISVWSSTPDLDTRQGNRSFGVEFFTGRSWVSPRSASKGVRLVLIDP